MMMDDEQNLQLDRPGRGKSVETIRKHTVDAQFENKPIERALYLLTKGDEVQKLSVIQALPQLLQYDSRVTYARILPKIQQELPNSSCEFHLMTSKVFRLLIERQLPVNLINSILQGIESRDPIVSNTWLETLLAVMPLIPEERVINDILPVTIAKSQFNQTVQNRIISCKLLGRIATHPKMDRLNVKRDILPPVHGLCQDYSYDVRAAICTHLPFVAHGLGSAAVQSNLLPSLVELASDDNMNVRSAAVVSIVLIFPYLNLETKKGTMVPLVRQLCQKSMKTGDITGTAVAKELGKLLDGLDSCLSMNDCTWFLQCYKTLAHRGLATPGDLHNIDASQDVMCRQNCAFNLPALTYFTLTSIPTQLDTLYNIFRDLAADPCYIVRRTVAGGIHEIAKILGVQNKLIKADLVRLLRDDAEEVLQTLVPLLGDTLELLFIYGTLSKEVTDVATTEIGRALLKCQSELSRGFNWRMQTEFVSQLQHLPRCMPSDFIHQHFTPVVLSLAVQGRAKPVRFQAAKTLLVFLRNNVKEVQRKWLRDNLINQLCYSKSFYTRHVYVKLCIHAMELFSQRYFKEHFYLPLLTLGTDPVANLRLCVVRLLPNLHQMVEDTDDRKYRKALDSVMASLEGQEKDKDVLEILKQSIKDLNVPLVLDKEEHEYAQKLKQEEEYNMGSAKPLNSANAKDGLSKTQPTRRSTIGLPTNLEKPIRSISVPPKLSSVQKRA